MRATVTIGTTRLSGLQSTIASQSALEPKNKTTRKSRGFFFEVNPGVNSSVIFVSERDDAQSRFGHYHRLQVRSYSHSLRVPSSASPRGVDSLASSTMVNRSEYQPIAQSIDEEEVDVAGPVPSSSAGRPRRSSISKKIDLGKLDNAFKRCVPWIASRGIF